MNTRPSSRGPSSLCHVTRVSTASPQASRSGSDARRPLIRESIRQLSTSFRRRAGIEQDLTEFHFPRVRTQGVSESSFYVSLSSAIT